MASLLQQTASTDRENAQEKISYPAVTPEMKLVQEALFRHVGKPIPRKEDGRLITGKGRFSDDFSLPGQTLCGHGAFALPACPYSRHRYVGSLGKPGRSGGLDRSGHIGRRDCADTAQPRSSTKFDMVLTAPDGGKPFVGPHYLLPNDKARHVGEAVAVVIAETAAQAVDAAEKVAVDL